VIKTMGECRVRHLISSAFWKQKGAGTLKAPKAHRALMLKVWRAILLSQRRRDGGEWEGYVVFRYFTEARNN